MISLCCYSPSGNGGFCELVELPLLRRLLSLFTDKLDLSFLCILCDTGVDGCFLGCSLVGASLVPGPEPPVAPVGLFAPQEHVRAAPGCMPLLNVGLPVLLW